MGKWFLLFIGLIVVSCKNEKTKIAFMLPNLRADRYMKEKVYFTEKVNESGYEVEFYNADLNQELQFNQVKECLDKGIRIFVLDAQNVNLAAKIVRDVHEKNGYVIAYDRLIKNADLDYYISFKYEAVGEEVAKYVLNLSTGGNFVYLGGDKTDNNALFIDNGIFKILNPYLKDNKAHILHKVYIEDWNADMAYNEVSYFLNLSGVIPDAVICPSDKMASGVIRSLKEHGLIGKVALTGMDADKAACRNIIAGRQSMTVYKPVKQLAYTAAEIAIKIAQKKKIENVNDHVWNGLKEIPSILIQPITVDKNNLKSTVIADGFHQESDIFQ